jgi:outer membrane protein assembly factor BamB
MAIPCSSAIRGLRFSAAAALLLFAVTAGCQILSGLSDLEVTQGGAPTACEPGSVEGCYTGPDGTQDVGVCAAGSRTCALDGSGWGECSGEVTPDPSPENCAAGMDLNCDDKAACTGALLWAGTTSSSDAFLAQAIAVDSTGDVVVVGSFRGMTSFGEQKLATVDDAADAFVVKLDPAGAVKWVKQYGGTLDDDVVTVAIAPDDSILIAGYFTTSITFKPNEPAMGQGMGDIFVARLNPDGVLLWEREWGDPSPQTALGITVDGEEGVVVGGRFGGILDFGQGAFDAIDAFDGFVVKLDAATGDTLWSATLDSSGNDEVYAVAVDSAGDVVVGGSVFGEVSFNGMPVMGNMGGGAFVGRLGGSAGNFIGGDVVGEMGAPGAYVVTDAARAGAEGEVVIIGLFNGSIQFPPQNLLTSDGIDLFIAKLDAAGNALWSIALGGDLDDGAQEVAVDPFGNITVVGGFEGPLQLNAIGSVIASAGMRDGYILKLTPNGDILWGQSVASSKIDVVYGVAVDATGASFITGIAGPDAKLAGVPLTGESLVNIFYSKLDP